MRFSILSARLGGTTPAWLGTEEVEIQPFFYEYRVDFANTLKTAATMLQLHLLDGLRSSIRAHPTAMLVQLLNDSVGVVLCQHQSLFWRVGTEDYHRYSSGLEWAVPILGARSTWPDDGSVTPHTSMLVRVGPALPAEMLARGFPLFEYLQMGTIE